MSAATRAVHALALGAWVRSTRELAGLAQGELAAQVGVSQSLLSRWETGAKEPDAYQLNLLPRALGGDVAGLCAAVERVQAAMLRAARALVDDEGAPWEVLLPQLGETSLEALALAAARVWLEFHPKAAKPRGETAARA